MELIILPLFFVAMYFVLIRPQRKRQQEVQDMQSSLAVGDDVVTIGGLHGEVTEIGADHVDLQVTSDGVVLRFRRSSVADVIREPATVDEDHDA